MQPMSPAERAAYVREKAEARKGLQAQIGALAAERHVWGGAVHGSKL
jgi:hypothetical protein